MSENVRKKLEEILPQKYGAPMNMFVRFRTDGDWSDWTFNRSAIKDWPCSCGKVHQIQFKYKLPPKEMRENARLYSRWDNAIKLAKLENFREKRKKGLIVENARTDSDVLPMPES